MTDPTAQLPIDALRERFDASLAGGPVVVTAPTGSGKSTQVPRWCASRGRVLVVEPRRVACRSVAARVAELEGARLGREVGYVVRDDARATSETGIVFATPGVVLRWLSDGTAARFAVLVLDEFHERTRDLDLIEALATLRMPPDSRKVVMSATLAGDRVAEHVGGVHLRGEGRTHPVAVHHVAGDALLPAVRGLETRLVAALERAAGDPGDVLVFLPGKGEIAAAAQALAARDDLEILPLHGGLSLDQQSRIFRRGRRRRVILATNVAETSLTVPGVGVVIDSGLVRRTRYHRGRGFLTLVPVALDSAEQRAGRAGRTAPGVCYRLWSASAQLAERTPPEIARESLTPLVLAAAAAGERVTDLPLLDPPAAHAVEAAVEELRLLGALDDGGAATEAGRRMFELPIDAPLARLLLAARDRDAATLQDAIDLVAALASTRSLFWGPIRDPEADLRAVGCDAVALITAVRRGDPGRRPELDAAALAEARRHAERLRAILEAPTPDPERRIDRSQLIAAALAGWPDAAHVPRTRRGKTTWAGGGPEIALSDRSAAAELGSGMAIRDAGARRIPEALVVCETRAVGVGYRDTRIIATCAMPATHRDLLAAGVGERRAADPAVDERGRLVAVVETTLAGRVIGREEAVPTGDLARRAATALILAGRLFRGTAEAIAERLDDWALAVRLARRQLIAALDVGEDEVPSGPPEQWLEAHLATLGFERGDELPLLSAADLVPAELPARTREALDRSFPREVDVGDASYRVHYDLGRRVVTLELATGRRKDLPPPTLIPAFRGFGVHVKDGSRVRVLR